jgi:glycolate oxidase iron-sulfur subunit
MRPAENPSTSPHQPLRTDAGPFGVDYGAILACIHCGLCLPTCPTYDLTGEERHSPRGRIQMMRSIADGKMELDEAFADSLDFCLGCYACETACPAGVDYSALFEASRDAIEDRREAQGEVPWIKRVLLRHVFPHPRRLKALARLLRLGRRSGLQGLGVRSGLLGRLAPRLAALEPMAPEVSPRFSDQLIAEVERPDGPVHHRVALLTGCVMNVAFAEVNRMTADLLLACGCEVHRPPAQTCCGSLHGHNGDLETARALARRNIAAFGEALPLEELDAIVVNAAGCGAFMKEYGHVLADDAAWAERAAAFTRKVRDVSEFLAGIQRPAPQHAVPMTATVHDACHLAHAQGITHEPRLLLADVPGLVLTPLPDATRCCGSAGIYNILQPEAAQTLGEQKLAAVRTTGADAVVTGNPGCALQISAMARQAGHPVAVLHPVEVLHRAYFGPAPPAA